MSGAQQILVPMDKAATAAGGKTILELEFNRIGSGMEKVNEAKGIGNSLDFGARIYDSRLGRWLSLDPLQVKYPSNSPYGFVRNSPIFKRDIEGEWDIEVHAFNSRGLFGYGLVIVKNRSGDVVYRTIARVQGSATPENNNTPRDRMRTNGDTPTGDYSIGNWENKAVSVKYRKSYGPNKVLRLTGRSGEIVQSGRSGILMHGGRQETYDVATKTWTASSDPVLKPTYGCFRMFDNDISEMKTITDELERNDPLEQPGILSLRNDLIRDEQSGKYFTPGDYSSLTTARSKLTWSMSSDIEEATGDVLKAQDKGIDNNTVTQPAADDTEQN